MCMCALLLYGLREEGCSDISIVKVNAMVNEVIFC